MSPDAGGVQHLTEDDLFELTTRRFEAFAHGSTFLEIVREAEHLVGGLNRFRVRLIRALSGEYRHHLIDDADVRALEISLFEPSEAADAGSPGAIGPGRRRRVEQAVVEPKRVEIVECV